MTAKTSEGRSDGALFVPRNAGAGALADLARFANRESTIRCPHSGGTDGAELRESSRHTAFRAANLDRSQRRDMAFGLSQSTLGRMQEVSPVITRQTSIWRAGLGSHASDSSGAIFLGVIYLFLAFELSRLLLSAVILFCL